jgi:hypothetical protein
VSHITEIRIDGTQLSGSLLIDAPKRGQLLGIAADGSDIVLWIVTDEEAEQGVSQQEFYMARNREDIPQSLPMAHVMSLFITEPDHDYPEGKKSARHLFNVVRQQKVIHPNPSSRFLQ